MLKAKGLSRYYGSVRAADDVSFDITSGEIVGLLGHNGAGKTTVMKLLTGFIEPTAGNAWVNDINVQEDPVTAQSRLGYLPESTPLYNEMSVVDYLMFAATVRRIPLAERTDKVKAVLQATDLLDRLEDTIGTLSRGYRQRVAVAQAILHEPSVLILDEPTNGLDPSQTVQMRDLIQRLAESATVILSTHIMQEVDAICDRVLIMSNGQLVVDEQLAKLSETNQVSLKTPESQEKVRSLTKTKVEPGTKEGEYIVEVTGAGSIDDQISELTSLLISNDVKVQAISPARNDLETLFSQVSGGATS